MTLPYERSASIYDRIYGDKAYYKEAAALRDLIEHEHSGARSLLEVGCGTGGHLVHLAEVFDCVGIDLSRSMLDIAQSKLPDIPFITADMRTFDLGRRFDVVTSLFSCIGYVRSVDELQATVHRMAEHLNPGGILVIEPWFTPEQWNPDSKIRGGILVDEEELKIVRMVVSEQRDRFAITPMHHLVATLRGIEYFVETHELFLATRDEYEASFAAAGLKGIRHDPNMFARGAWLGQSPA